MASSSLKVTLIPPNGEKMERIFDSHSITVGRSNKCDLILDTESLSRQHCRIEFEDGQFYITDLSSTNGVFIEGTRIEPLTKVAFNNFLQLQISVFDCLVQEVEVTAIRNPPILRSDNLSLMTRPTKKLNRVALNAPLKMLPKDKSVENNNKIKFMASAAVALIILVFAMSQEKEVEKVEVVREERGTVQAILQHKTSQSKVKSEDAFLSANIYMSLHNHRNCQEQVYCDNLFIKLEDGEGLAKENNDYVVFLKPSKHLTNPKYAKIAEADADIIAFDLFMTSRILDDYLTDKIDQIHLGIIDSTGNVRTVYRFHPSKFSLSSISRQVINPLLEKAINENKPQEYWDVILVPVQKLDLPQ